MNGKKLSLKFKANINKAEAIFKKIDDGENDERSQVGMFIIQNPDILQHVSDGESLEKAVFDTARVRGQYAGISYTQGEELDPDDLDHRDTDEGLSWVGYLDLWDIFIEIDKLLED